MGKPQEMPRCSVSTEQQLQQQQKQLARLSQHPDPGVGAAGSSMPRAMRAAPEPEVVLSPSEEIKNTWMLILRHLARGVALCLLVFFSPSSFFFP